MNIFVNILRAYRLSTVTHPIYDTVNIQQVSFYRVNILRAKFRFGRTFRPTDLVP